MNKFIFKQLAIFFLILSSVNISYAEMKIQTLSVGDDFKEEQTSNLNENTTQEENNTEQKNNNTKFTKESLNIQTQNIVAQPYISNPNYQSYTIGPSKQTKVYGYSGTYNMPGAFDYKNYSYNYGSGKRTIKVKVPVRIPSNNTHNTP